MDDLRARRICAAACVLILSLVVRSAAAEDIEALAEKTNVSVVHLVIVGPEGKEGGTGSGFFVAPDRIATNHHVIERAAEIVAKLHDGRELDATGMLASDEENDLAVIQVAGGAAVPPLELGDFQSVKQGQDVYVIGSPYGLAGTLSTGIVSAIRREGLPDAKDDERLRAWGMQITAPIAPGSSGSPVLTYDGKVVAVAVGIVDRGATVGFGVPVDNLERLLDTIPEGAEPQPFPEATSVARNLIISAIFFSGIALAFVAPSAFRRLRKR